MARYNSPSLLCTLLIFPWANLLAAHILVSQDQVAHFQLLRRRHERLETSRDH